MIPRGLIITLRTRDLLDFRSAPGPSQEPGPELHDRSQAPSHCRNARPASPPPQSGSLVLAPAVPALCPSPGASCAARGRVVKTDSELPLVRIRS
jgi:hypothetical protein